MSPYLFCAGTYLDYTVRACATRRRAGPIYQPPVLSPCPTPGRQMIAIALFTLRADIVRRCKTVDYHVTGSVRRRGPDPTEVPRPFCSRNRSLRKKCEYILTADLTRSLLFGETFLISIAGIYYVLQYDWSFWTIFVSLVLALTMLLMIMFQVADVIARAVFGSFFLIIALDYYTNTNLKYIIITMIRRISIPKFCSAFVFPPIQGEGTSALLSLFMQKLRSILTTPALLSDLTLICIWAILIVLRFIRICREPSSCVTDETQALLG